MWLDIGTPGPRLLRALGLLVVLAPWGWARSPTVPARVTLQLHWHHQFQFAGYYAAVQLGYYREAGLDVTIRPAVTGEESIPHVLSGKADFGVGGPDLLLHHGKGQRVRLMAAIFQHSPLVLLARKDKGIATVHDLRVVP